MPALPARSHVKGLHLNMAFVVRGLHALTLLLGRRFRRLFGYTERDVELMYPLREKMFHSLLRESGYMHIQCTKPDTVGACPPGAAAGGGGYVCSHRRLPPGLSPAPAPPSPAGCALNDSPVGLAAYILEKFSTWTSSDFRDLEDGGLER